MCKILVISDELMFITLCVFGQVLPLEGGGGSDHAVATVCTPHTWGGGI